MERILEDEVYQCVEIRSELVIWLKKIEQLQVFTVDTYSFINTEGACNWQGRHLGPSHGHVMRYGVDSFSPSSWEPQEEGMMNIAARFSLSKKPRFIDLKGKKPNDWRWCLLACDSFRQSIRRLVQCFALPATTRNLYTTQPNTLLPTNDEVVNLTGLL
jgi:hypothetical protein